MVGKVELKAGCVLCPTSPSLLPPHCTDPSSLILIHTVLSLRCRFIRILSRGDKHANSYSLPCAVRAEWLTVGRSGASRARRSHSIRMSTRTGPRRSLVDWRAQCAVMSPLCSYRCLSGSSPPRRLSNAALPPHFQGATHTTVATPSFSSSLSCRTRHHSSLFFSPFFPARSDLVARLGRHHAQNGASRRRGVAALCSHTHGASCIRPAG